MNKKPTGLIASAMAETPAERAKREYIDTWGKDNRDLVQDLKKLTKDRLVKWLTSVLVGSAYDEAISKANSRALEEEFPVVNDQDLYKALLEGSSDDARSILNDWMAAKIVRAEGDILQIANAAYKAGAATVRINERPRLQTAKKQKENLAKGPIEAAKKRTKEANARNGILEEAINALFDKPDKPGWVWTNDEITSFLYGQSTIESGKSAIAARVKTKAAEFRKRRKELLASRYPSQ